MVKLKVDLEKCAMSGQCYYMHPDLVQMREDGYPELIDAGVASADEAAIIELVDTCPVMAIEVNKT